MAVIRFRIEEPVTSTSLLTNTAGTHGECTTFKSNDGSTTCSMVFWKDRDARLAGVPSFQIQNVSSGFTLTPDEMLCVCPTTDGMSIVLVEHLYVQLEIQKLLSDGAGITNIMYVDEDGNNVEGPIVINLNPSSTSTASKKSKKGGNKPEETA